MLEYKVSEKRKKNFPYPIREHIDADYLKKLTPEERQWYYQFEDEYYGNHHRKGELFSKQENYKEEIKEQLDDKNNAMRRCFYANRTRLTVRSNDIASLIYDSYADGLMEDIKKKGVEKTVLGLIEDTAYAFIQEGLNLEVKSVKDDLAKLCMDVTKALQLEKKYRKSKRRKK